MSSEIRRDFQPVPWQLERLLQYAKIFKKYNEEDWPHFKHQEDFHHVYDLDMEDRLPLEKIYSMGRDLSVAMSDRLVWFNYPDYCPTLTVFLNAPAFNDAGWLGQIPLLEEISLEAKNKVSELSGRAPWAIGQMISLYDKQIKLLYEVKKCLDGLRLSEIYLHEQGIESGNVYLDILSAINNMGKNFEAHASTYRHKDEESLRDIILAGIKSVPNLIALGEAFNNKGKTDILVGRNENIDFIGECKFWHGPEGFFQTVKQLMGYSTWRNEKLAIILFVKNKDMAKVVNKAQELIQECDDYITSLHSYDETWFNYRFNNGDKDVELALMLYHIPE